MLKLYTAQICPFAHRARLALAVKGLQHERQEIDLRAMPQWYRALSPNDSVPLLVHNDQKVWESLVIMEYVDDAFPARPLRPQDAYGKARMRLVFDLLGSTLIGKTSALWKDPHAPLPSNDELWNPLVNSMDSPGPYWLGEYLTLADLAAYPWFERLGVFEHIRGRKFDLPKRLEQWREAVASYPAVEQEAEPLEFYLDSFAAARR